MAAFFGSLAAIFGLEMFDKTQLVALCLASRYKVKVVLAGILVATLVVHVLSVALGGGLGKLMPQEWINLVAGLAFIGFGLWTLKGDSLDDEECNRLRGRSPFMLVATTFFLAELGDKTMLSTVALATKYPVIPVWLGSSLGMVVSDGLAILVGRILGARLPDRAIKVGAAIIFFGFGAFSAVQGLAKLPGYSWAIAIGAAGGMVSFYLYQARKEREMQRRLEAAVGEPGPAPVRISD